MIFTALPLLAATVFVSSVLSASSQAERLFSLLGLASLLTTAYIMKYSPLQPDRKGKKPVTFHTERIARLHAALVPGNTAICLLLAVVYFTTGSSYGIQPVVYLIPGGKSLPRLGDIESDHVIVMLAVILLAQKVMLSVDLASLKDLQYEYKGA